MVLKKVVLVTGGANGIGKAVSLAYIEQGATVIVADRDQRAGEALIQTNEQLFFFNTNLRDAQSVASLFEFINKKWGTLDILINNAGIMINQPLLKLSIDEWDEVLETNLRSAFLCTKEAVKLMGQGGAIINIASTRAFMSEADTESYAASKGGLIALTHSLAISLSEQKITVNAISPGWIETERYDNLSERDHNQHPANRVGTPDDIARACLFLSAPANNFITGENLIVDGGMTKKMIYQ
ncbi:hypothetical protein SAMN04488134_1098 [Amphibacillus marinus]|uniref:NAD(P)-dependent dehydrogenase, short-chain alcohol dehydrogenase family n=1 Tax=Amphibacillus marinus TaxID=872970 RepID=A0A1H8QQJ8_9BACI|nr:SDR family oxidoreductase [Amphibacillus marinus]SEO56237.1 hypothetical protein SAMN04488134_1098 [Amphibacillus marinus]